MSVLALVVITILLGGTSVVLGVLGLLNRLPLHPVVEKLFLKQTDDYYIRAIGLFYVIFGVLILASLLFFMM